MPARRRILIVRLLLVLSLSVWFRGATRLAPGDGRAIAAGSVGEVARRSSPTSRTDQGSSKSPFVSLGVYRGLGTWIDIYDVAWKYPGTAVRRIQARDVGTLYLETSNFSRGRMMVFPDGVRRFLDAAHRNGIAVVAWYLPGLRDLPLDVHRSLGAIRYRTPGGNSFDSFALDIESEARRLAGAYDVFLPMTYFTFQVTGRFGARWYTAGNIDIIRQQTGDRSVPIHVIGGIGGDATKAETAGFVDAVRGRRAIGGSFYTFPFTTPADWSMLERLRSVR